MFVKAKKRYKSFPIKYKISMQASKKISKTEFTTKDITEREIKSSGANLKLGLDK